MGYGKLVIIPLKTTGYRQLVHVFSWINSIVQFYQTKMFGQIRLLYTDELSRLMKHQVVT